MPYRDTYKFGGVTLTGPGPICATEGVVGADALPLEPGALTLYGASASDADGGAGMQAVYVAGLRGEPGATRFFEATFATDGTGVVETGIDDCFRCFRLRAARPSGATGAVARNVDHYYAKIGDAVANRMLADYGASTTSFFSVADDEIGRLRAMRGFLIQYAGGTAPRVEIRFYSGPFGGPYCMFCGDTGLLATANGHAIKEYSKPGIEIRPGFDMYAYLLNLGGANSVKLSFEYDIRTYTKYSY